MKRTSECAEHVSTTNTMWQRLRYHMGRTKISVTEVHEIVWGLGSAFQNDVGSALLLRKDVFQMIMELLQTDSLEQRLLGCYLLQVLKRQCIQHPALYHDAEETCQHHWMHFLQRLMQIYKVN
jgi:hypothetical protein